MIKYIYILCMTRFVLSNCYILISTLSENDIGFVSNAANFLVSKGLDCTVLIPGTFQDLITLGEKVNILTFESNSGYRDTLEEEFSGPVPQVEVDSLLKTCESLVKESPVVELLLKDPPTTGIFPSFLHDACVLPLIAYLNSQVTTTKSQKITTFLWTSNYLSDSWVYYHLTSSIIPTSDVESGTYSRIKNFVNWWLFVREINGGFVEPAIGIMKSNLQNFESHMNNPQNLPELYENGVNLTLVSTHPLFTPPTPMALGISPLTVNIGCFHCRSATPLPKDLEEQIMKYKAGAMIVESDFKFKVPEVMKQAILEASKALPFSVFWQTFAWNNSGQTQYTGLPESVLVQKSLPLQDLLGHPRCRIFVSRCSMESVLIATYHGVPMICLPATHYDKSVASYVEKHGIGVILPRKNITGKLLLNAISGVTNDPSFRMIVRHLAETLRDQPETPGDRFIFAIQNLERHRDHMHYSHLKKQSFITTHHWDVCVALTLVMVLFLFTLSCGLYFLYHMFSNNEEAIHVSSKKII